MRIIVYPHTLELGGSQLNAIEIAGAVRDRGHDVVIFAQPGTLAERIDELGLEFVVAPRPRGRPTPRVVGALTELARRYRADVVHGYEWTTVIEAYWGPRARLGVPVAATVMSMAVAPFIPTDLPLAVGYEQIVEIERRAGRPDVTLIEPPVDVAGNAPGAADPDELRHDFGLDPDALTVVSVSRLAPELKLEGLETAIEATAELAAVQAIQLVITGDGPARPLLEERAAEANRRVGRRVVFLTGQLVDPRPAYAAADVCLGMGGSALRAMAFARPLIVQGEAGFWKLLDSSSEDFFLANGWYGLGEGRETGVERLISQLRPLIDDPDHRAALGARAREVVVTRFALEVAAERQIEIYSRMVASGRIPPRRRLEGAGRSTAGLVSHRFRRAVASVRGRDQADDFNARKRMTVASVRAV